MWPSDLEICLYCMKTNHSFWMVGNGLRYITIVYHAFGIKGFDSVILMSILAGFDYPSLQDLFVDTRVFCEF
jgi:hypothetical protein